MTETAPSSPVTVAVIEALEESGHPVGDGRRPSTVSDQPSEPYWVVYGGGMAGLDGSLAEPRQDGTHVVQIQSIGLDVRGAEALRDLAASIVLDRSNLDVEGRRVMFCELETSLSAQRDDDLKPPLFYCVTRVRIETTAA